MRSLTKRSVRAALEERYIYIVFHLNSIICFLTSDDGPFELL